MGFVFFLEHLTLWGLLLLSSAGVLWLAQRLSLLTTNLTPLVPQISQVSGGQPSTHLRLLLVLITPSFIFYTLLQRYGVPYLDSEFSTSALRWGFCSESILITLFFLTAPAHVRQSVSATWFLEQLGVVLFLGFAWVMFFFSRSFLTSLLWLEIVGLLALLLLGFFGYGTPALGSLAGPWRLFFFNEAGGFGVAHALLTLLWVNGLAAVLLLFGWVLVCSTGFGLDFELLSLFVISPDRALSGLGLYSFSFGVAFMLKVLLPPLQFFLLSVYRSLPLQAVVPYVFYYYSIFIPALFSCLLGPLSVFLSGWVFLWAVSLLAVYLTLIGGLASLGEFRFTLAFSSALNLTFMLIVLPSLL